MCYLTLGYLKLFRRVSKFPCSYRNHIPRTSMVVVTYTLFLYFFLDEQSTFGSMEQSSHLIQVRGEDETPAGAKSGEVNQRTK